MDNFDSKKYLVENRIISETDFISKKNIIKSEEFKLILDTIKFFSDYYSEYNKGICFKKTYNSLKIIQDDIDKYQKHR